ncbi:hypothetical protein DYB32_008119 [Aphanomyces invadans]|uniref:Nucleoporin Nup133/Nup155-like N-terminal domain-containing protein n=1 Tax=Aphanomyces invadans TaxID=157072 RepID=A0A418AM67_9STRA|nr:hypothetical protein DYB32_008119 [Aphanomyces invadans]
MTRPEAQVKDATSIQRALKELGKAADLAREREKKVDVTPRFQSLSTSSTSLETMYVMDPATTRWGPDLVPSTELIPWPASVLESIRRQPSTTVPMGLFPEIQHAWAVVDATSLMLWDYRTPSAGVVLCPVVSSPIVAAGLVLPLPGTLFSDQVQHLLVILTELDVRLFALIVDKAATTASTRPWKIIDTLMTAPLANTQLCTSIVCTPSRRILLGGIDGTLYEYVYSPNLPPTDNPVKFRCVQPAVTSPWAAYLPNVVRDLLFPSPNAAIAALVVDAPRRLLYVTYVQSNVVSVYDIRSDIVLASSVNLTDLASQTLGSHVALAPLAAIAPIDSSSSVQAVALTTTGQRLALAFDQSYTLKALYLRAVPPALAPSSTMSGGFSHIVAQPGGVTLVGHASAHQFVSLAATAAVPPSTQVVETATVLPVLGTLHSLVAIPSSTPSLPPSSSSSSGAKRSADGSVKAPSSPLDVLKNLGTFGTQFSSTPAQFLVLSSEGVQIYSQTRLVDQVDTLLRRSASLAPVVECYGAPQVATVLFGLSHNPAAAHAVCALDAADTSQGLVQFVAYVLAPVWAAPLTQAPSTKPLQWTLDKLNALKHVLEQVVPLALALHTDMDISLLQSHHVVIRDIHRLVGRCADALFGWLQLSALSKKEWPKEAGIPFHDVVGTEAGAATFQALLINLAKDSPTVVPRLLAHSSAFFSVWEAAPYQGLQTIAAAKVLGRDTLLQESLTQLRQNCAQWPPTKPTLQLLRHILKEYAAASFYYGMVEITVAVARVFTAATTTTTVPASACYDTLLTFVVTRETQEAVAKYACQANDGGLLEEAVLPTLPDLSVLQSCPWTRTIQTFLQTNHPDWYQPLRSIGRMESSWRCAELTVYVYAGLCG